MQAIAHGGGGGGEVVRTHVRESALKVDSGRKIPCSTGVSNLLIGVPVLRSTNWATSPPQDDLLFTSNDKCEKLGMIELLVAMEPALKDLPDDRPPLFRDHFF